MLEQPTTYEPIPRAAASAVRAALAGAVIGAAVAAISIYGEWKERVGWNRRGCNELVYSWYPRGEWEAAVTAGDPFAGEWPAENCVELMGDEWRDEVMRYYDQMEANNGY